MSHDAFGRHINYLRISVTDRCNYRCRYCMPEAGVIFKEHDKLLSLEDIVFFVEVAQEFGIKNLRLTGGEPLVRSGITDLIHMLKHLDSIQNIALTTNGALLPKMAGELKRAGLDRVNISLDTLDPESFKYITRRGTLDEVIAGIDAALEVGFHPVKINCVVVRSLKQNLIDFIRMSVEKELHVRFIEYMPVGESAGFDDTGWSEQDTIPNDELLAHIQELAREAGYGELQALDRTKLLGFGPAHYYSLPHAKGSLGFIAARSNHFCSSCNRLRLTSEGELRPCLFSDLEYHVADAIKQRNKDGIRTQFKLALQRKPESHALKVGTERLMSQIGG